MDSEIGAGQVKWAGGTEPTSDPHRCPFRPAGTGKNACIEDLSGRNAEFNRDCCGTRRGMVEFPPCNFQARRCRACLEEGRRGLKSNAVTDVAAGLCHEHAAEEAEGKTFGEVLPRDPRQVRPLVFGETVVVNGVRRREFPETPDLQRAPSVKAPLYKRVQSKDTGERRRPLIASEASQAARPAALAEPRPQTHKEETGTAAAIVAASKTRAPLPESPHVEEPVLVEVKVPHIPDAPESKEVPVMDAISVTDARHVAADVCAAKRNSNLKMPSTRKIYEAVVALKEAGMNPFEVGDLFGQSKQSAASWTSSIVRLSHLQSDVWTFIEGKDVTQHMLLVLSRSGDANQLETLQQKIAKKRLWKSGRRATPPNGPASARKSAAPPSNGHADRPDDHARASEKASVPAVIPQSADASLPVGLGIGNGITMLPISDEMLAAGVASGKFVKGNFIFVGPPDANGVSRGRVVSFGDA